MNEIKNFTFDGSSVRTLTIDEKPYFIGKDVAEILGYADPKDAIRKHVDEEDKQVIQKRQNATLEIPNRGLTVINESGLYSLILSSKLPTAKRFKRWVTSEVLPVLREHGVYADVAMAEKLLDNPDFMIKTLQALKAERSKIKELETVVAVQSQQVEELRPKASYYDVVLNCKDLLSISKIAKDFGWSAVKMNAYLHDKGIQYKQGDIWLLYQKYADKGYTNTKTHPYIGSDGETHTRVHTHWTQKGRLFIYDLLKSEGILPLIEREEEHA